MNLLEIIARELNQISQQVCLTVEIVSHLPFVEDEDFFQKAYRETSQTNAYWIPWTEQLGAWIESNGLKVSVVIREDGLDSDIRQLMVGLASVITGVCLNLQGKVAIHANAVVVEGLACAFAGCSGRGKSTLTAYCASKGAGFVTDDVLVVDSKGLVIPGNPQLKLYPHTGKSLGLNVRETNNYKIFYDVKHLGAKFDSAPIPLSAIYLLEKSDDNRIYTERLIPSQAVFEVLTHSYYASELISYNPQILETYINLIACIPVKKLYYPRSFQLLPQVYDFLQREMHQLLTLSTY